MDIRSESHTDKKKAYLTYGPQPAAKARLLTETKKKVFDVLLDDKKIYRLRELNSKTKKALEDSGFIIDESWKIYYVGVRFFTKADGTKIPVTVRQLKDKGVLKQIRVRITDNTHEDLMNKTYAVRDTLAAYGLKHKLCVWDRTGILEPEEKTPINKKITEDNMSLDEQHKLKNVVDDLKEELNELKNKPLKKAISDEREVRAGILA